MKMTFWRVGDIIVTLGLAVSMVGFVQPVTAQNRTGRPAQKTNVSDDITTTTTPEASGAEPTAAPASGQQDVIAPAETVAVHPVAYLPVVSGGPQCPTTSGTNYSTIGINGGYYKNNALTDANADFRLSILGYAPSNGYLGFTSYGGGTGGGDGPLLTALFSPRRVPQFKHVYQVYQWNWNSPPPYGSRGSVNTSYVWDTTVADVATTSGERIYLPSRNAQIATNYRAMVLYAGVNELTLTYMNQDQVQLYGTGYVVHLMNFCVDPNLVSLYRAQLDSNGYRKTGQLPALNNGQAIGTALGSSITLAVRDGGAFMDPRVKADWWYDLP